MSGLGIMGGTFNPIHTAHLVIAQSALEQYNLAKVMFLPNAIPPHKRCDYMASRKLRLEMVRSAVSSNKRFFVSDYEINVGGFSYTAETMKHFKRMYDDDIYFIIGGDSLRDFGTWYKPDEISRLCTLLVYPRGDVDVKKAAAELGDRFGTKIGFISSPRLDISSTGIRESVRAGRSIKYLVPDGVEKIIMDNGLYAPR